MITKILDFIGSFFRAIFNFLGRAKWFIFGGGLILLILSFTLSGYAFLTVYHGIIPTLIVIAIISLLIPATRWVLTMILIAGLIWFAVDKIVLDVAWPFLDNSLSDNFASYKEWRLTKKELINNQLAKDILKNKQMVLSSDVIRGTFGKISEDSVVYDDAGNEISGVKLKTGQEVMSLGLLSKKQSESSPRVVNEGMLRIAIPNENGDFVRSKSFWIPIRKVIWENERVQIQNKTAPSASTSAGWEKVTDCQIPFFGRVFDDRVGPSGERAYTGEVYVGCSLESGYDYKITHKEGTYSWNFAPGYPWYTVSWQGWNPQSQGIVKPFPDFNYGALMLRIGNKEGLHPETKKDFIIFTPTEAVKIFAELNINREYAEYYSKVGLKLKNSTLSIKLERRPL